MNPNDVMFCASDLGWVVGHSYIHYGPLLLGATSIVFEGKPVVPDAGIWWRICSQYKVTQMFCAPTALRAIVGQDADAKLMRAQGVDLRSLRTLFLAGERSEPQIVARFEKLLKELAAPGAQTNDVSSVPPPSHYSLPCKERTLTYTSLGCMGIELLVKRIRITNYRSNAFLCLWSSSCTTW